MPHDADGESFRVWMLKKVQSYFQFASFTWLTCCRFPSSSSSFASFLQTLRANYTIGLATILDTLPRTHKMLNDADGFWEKPCE